MNSDCYCHAAETSNRFCHVEIPVSDISRAGEFYGKLFGWQVQETPDPGYVLIPGGGLRKVDQVTRGGAVSYVCVDDLGSYVEKVKSLGGKVEIEKEPAGQGWCSLFTDLDGNAVGLYQL